MGGLGGWIGVDLDGTLTHYDHWRGVEHIGDPIPLMVERVKEWLAEGKIVKIFTARVCPMGGRNAEEAALARDVIEAWCMQHLGHVLVVTHEKDLGMIELWDDRAVQVIPNTGQALRDLVAEGV